MSRAFKIKAVVLAAFAVASVVLMGVILSSMQDKLSVDDCTSDIRYEMESLPGLLAAADEETAQNTETFDAVYQSKAESVAFMANNNVGFAATDAKMAEYRDLLGVGNVMVVDRDGTVVPAPRTRAPISPTSATTSCAPCSTRASPPRRWRWSSTTARLVCATTPPASMIASWR